jgi:hypothetical protein
MENYKTIHENNTDLNKFWESAVNTILTPEELDRLLPKFKSSYIFELDKVEEENLAKYLNKLKKKYGSFGFLTYEFTPTGIGTVIKVRSSHEKKSKEITNLGSW